MVSTRPSPTPARGRISYPTAATYTPGDGEEAPTMTGSHPMQPVTSQESSDGERTQGFKTWWKANRGDKMETPIDQPHVFGVALSESIKYASVQISTAGADDKLYVWGIIPVVVAKCGLYLKEHATEVEGAFRISGSAKRMRDLQMIFDTGPRYGKDVDWNALDFSPHDVATIFRRFLTQAPESIVPADFYEDFRAVLADEISTEEAVERYKELVRAMPPINQYLLLYVLDLLSVFARKSDKNLMSAPNLALIFQPGVLSHPVHAMRPREHVLSQQVLEFLIEHQDHFLIGMQLTSKSPTKAPKPKKAKKPKAPPKPLPVKADPDLILPSDSDDEAPSGGYYIIEGNVRSPQPGSSELPAPNLIPPSPNKSTQRLPPPSSPIKHSTTPAIKEEMAASDSDDEVPTGGYEVRVSEAAQARERKVSTTKDNNQSKRRGSLVARLRGSKEER